MRQLMLLICLTSILPVATTAVFAAQPAPAVRTIPVRPMPLTSTQRQYAKQFGQRLARNPEYREIDADWRQFVKNQPRGTDFRALVALVRQEAINAKNQAIRLKRKQLLKADQQKTRLAHELTHIKQQRSTPALRSRTAELDKRYRIADDQQKLKQLELQGEVQKQQQLLQKISQISKAMHDVAMAVIRKIG